jgi:hypothetical protein
MRKKFLPLSFLLLLFTLLTSAQETKLTQPYNQLIISEVRLDMQDAAYLEVTNIGDSAINLSDVWFMNIRWGYGPHQPDITFDEDNKIDTIRWPFVMDQPDFIRKGPDQILGPGESFVISQVLDRIRPIDDGFIRHNPHVFKKSDLHLHQSEPDDEFTTGTFFPEYKCYNFDSVSFPGKNLMWTGYSSSMVLVHIFYDNEGNPKDSVTVDVANLVLNENNEKVQETAPVAGVEGAWESHIWVRKSNVTQGNLDWDESRGISSEDSEWLMIPNFHIDGLAYNTIGNHGNYSLSISTETLDINTQDGILTVPYGTQKADSIIGEFTLGDGMAWQYLEDTTSFADSAHTICQDGDILTFFAAGEDLETQTFTIEVSEPKDDIANVFPLRTLVYPNDTGAAVWGETPYYVTENAPEIDTIGDVPFATRVDTLFKYLEKAPNASWEIDWVDDIERVDLKKGDILRITAENSTTIKDYYIDVQDIVKSENAFLSAISWPDRPDFLDPLVWNTQDTIPGFSDNTFLYTIELPADAREVPALAAHPQSQNATVSIYPAENINGNLEQRTTTITVTAELDTVSLDYKVIFDRDIPDALVQPFESEPIISEILGRQWWNAAIEIANPGTVPLDLSQYMIVVSKQPGKTPAEAIQDIVPQIEGGDYSNRYMVERCYIPGYKWPATRELYDANPGIMEFDPAVDPIVEPKDVFVMASWHRDKEWLENADVILSGNNNTWNESALHKRSMLNFMSGVDGIYIFKIKNDSILLGEKAIGDPADFELVEFFGKADGENVYHLAGREFAHNDRITFRRKPHFYWPTGGLKYEYGWGSTPDSSLWHANKNGDEFMGITVRWHSLSFDVGSHTFDPISAYQSTVSSLIYNVDDGYEGELYIEGVSWGETVDEFFGNLTQPDTGQTLTVLSNVDGSEKAMDASVETNDTLRVISADSSNVTKYILSTVPLDDNAVLTVGDGSAIEISIDDTAGIITGFEYNMSLQELLDNLNKPQLATLSIYNREGALVPLKRLNNDTNYVDTRVSDSYYFEVVAQNNVTAITYELQPVLPDNKPFVTSDVYVVDQDLTLISAINLGTSVRTFMNNLIVPEGLQVSVHDKADFRRDSGNIKFDDYLYVVSADGEESTTYFLQFIQEPEGTNAYVVSDVLTVMQDELEILGVTAGTTVEELMNVLTPSPAATMIVLDSEGNEVTTGEVMNDYHVEVTSGNGAVSATYSIDVVTAIWDNTIVSLEVYPNPVREVLHVDNIQTNSTVTIKNILGQTMMVNRSVEIHDGINVSNLPDGIYLLIIEKDNQVVGMSKFVKDE